MKKYILIAAFLLAIQPIFSQKDPIKFGKPGENDISLTGYQGADAVILCDYGQYYFDAKLGRVFLYFKRNFRLKILTEKGLKYATQVIPYYDLTKATYIPNSKGYELRAVTINTNPKGKLIKTKVKGKNIVNSDEYKDFNTDVTIHFPNVKVGSIIEYEVNIPTLDIVNPPIWYMQYNIPVMYSELRVTAPQDFDYGAKIYNSDSVDVFTKTSTGTAISYPRGSLSYMANRLRFVKANIAAYNDTENSYDPEYGRVYIKFMLEYASRKFALPGMEELFKAIDPTFAYLDRSEKYNTLNNSGFVLYRKPKLDDVARDLMKDPGFGPPLIINMGLNDTIRKITANCKTEEEKVAAIYNFVSTRISWDSTYRVFVTPGFSARMAGFVSRFTSPDKGLNTSLSKPFRKQEGSSSEINFILINLLNSAGIKAYPVLVSTLSHDVVDTSFFNLHEFNHVVADVEMKGKSYLLDAVKKDNGTILSTDPLNNFGLLIEKNGAEWIDLKSKYPGSPVIYR